MQHDSFTFRRHSRYGNSSESTGAILGRDRRSHSLCWRQPRTMRLSFCAVLAAFVALACSVGALQPNSSTTLTRIAFGSCNEHHLHQPLWSPMLEFAPQLFIWGGDVVYLDSNKYTVFRWPSERAIVDERFAYQKKRQDYQRVLASTQVVGVWDDHDMNCNDGDAKFPDKEYARQAFLDFLDEPADSARRTQSGLYASYTFGNEAGKRVKVILLDGRYNQDVEHDDMLGAEQWAWFEREMASTAMESVDLALVVTGLQVVSVGKFIGEGWRSTPRSRERVFKAIANSNPKTSFLILTGDIHYAELSHTHYCTGDRVAPLYDLTSSGMTHTWCHTFLNEWICTHIFPLFMMRTNTIGDAYLYLNFATLSIDWEKGMITAEIRNEPGSKHKPLKFELPMASLRPYSAAAGTLNEEARRDCKLEAERASGPPAVISGTKFAMVLIAAIALIAWLAVWVALRLSRCLVRVARKLLASDAAGDRAAASSAKSTGSKSGGAAAVGSSKGGTAAAAGGSPKSAGGKEGKKKR